MTIPPPDEPISETEWQHIAARESYCHRVYLPAEVWMAGDDALATICVWCDENVVYGYTYEPEIEEPDIEGYETGKFPIKIGYMFFIEDVNDAILFKLRWR